MDIENISKKALDSIRYFKSLRNEDEVIEYAKNNLNLIYPFTLPVKPNFCIYRTRPQKNINENEDMSSVSTFSYVPLEHNSKKIPSIGRFNLDGQSIFYASISASTNLKEMKDIIKEGDVVYISKWAFKENAKIRLYYIYPPEHLRPKTLQDSLLANVVDTHKVNPIIGDFLKELGYILLENNKEDNKYLKTAHIANNIYKLNYQGISYDAILYPSVQGHEYEFNLAIKPQYVDDNLVIQCVYEAIVKENRVEIDCSHIGINEKNQIQWYELYVYEDNIYTDSYSFLNSDKCPYTEAASAVYVGNEKFTMPEFGLYLKNKIILSNEHLNREGFFKEKFTLEDSIDSICIERSKYYDVKVNKMYFYISNIRYDISYIRVWINYKNSLKPV